MGKLVCTLTLALALSACANGKNTSESNAAGQMEMPDSCQLESSGAFRFIAWGTMQAERYVCPLSGFEKMNCYFLKTPDGAFREIQCENLSNADPQTEPAHCHEMYLEGITGADRVFFDGVQRSSNGLKCGMLYGLHCTYFQHRGISTAADDLLCVQY